MKQQTGPITMREIGCTDGRIGTGTLNGTAHLQSLHVFREICTVYRLVCQIVMLTSSKQDKLACRRP